MTQLLTPDRATQQPVLLPSASNESAEADEADGTEAALEGPNSVYMMGEYMVGDGEDTKLGGHPDIRY